MNETAIGHILAGRRKNLTVETIALLARAMEVRPELVLHDARPAGNYTPTTSNKTEAALSLAAQSTIQRNKRARSSAFDRTRSIFQASDLQTSNASAENVAYAQPELEEEDSQ
jgi:hypothetical protein